jgi:predicted nucleotidyltransferase
MNKHGSVPDRKLHWFSSPGVPISAIRRFARQVAEEFHPEKIILFGSYAYGQPHEDSDVDILVVMPTRDEVEQSIRIWDTIEPPFSLDLIVRTPRNLEWRLREGDWFLREVVAKGKVLYEKAHARMAAQSRSGLRSRKAASSR